MLKGLLRNNKGQSLIEILIAITVGAIIVGGAAATIGLSLRSNVQNKNLQSGNALAQEMLDKVTFFSTASWHNIYDLAKDPTGYYLTPSGNGFAASGPNQTEAKSVDGTNFSRSFTISNVSRDPSTGDIVSSGGTDDPSTQQVNITVTWAENGQPANTVLNKYLTRNRNLVLDQAGWVAGAGQAGPVTSINNRFDSQNGMDYSASGQVKALGKN